MTINISVVIPTHYRNNRLCDAITSAVEQTPAPTEIIIVDDSGEKHAAPIIDFWEGSGLITYLPLEENVGAQKARERGYELVSGDYIQFLDDDDQLHSNKFEQQVSVLESSDSGVVYSGLQLENGPKVFPKNRVQGDILEEALAMETWPCCIGTMLIESNCFETVKPVANDGDDYRLRIKLAQETTFEYVNEALITIGTNTNYSLGGGNLQLLGQERILAEFADLYDQYPDAHRKALSQVATSRAQYIRNTEFSDKVWSWPAIRESFRAAWLDYEAPRKELAIAFATLGGRPSLTAGEKLLSLFR